MIWAPKNEQKNEHETKSFTNNIQNPQNIC